MPFVASRSMTSPAVNPSVDPLRMLTCNPDEPGKVGARDRGENWRVEQSVTVQLGFLGTRSPSPADHIIAENTRYLSHSSSRRDPRTYRASTVAQAKYYLEDERRVVDVESCRTGRGFRGELFQDPKHTSILPFAHIFQVRRRSRPSRRCCGRLPLDVHTSIRSYALPNDPRACCCPESVNRPSFGLECRGSRDTRRYRRFRLCFTRCGLQLESIHRSDWKSRQDCRCTGPNAHCCSW